MWVGGICWNDVFSLETATVSGTTLSYTNPCAQLAQNSRPCEPFLATSRRSGSAVALALKRRYKSGLAFLKCILKTALLFLRLLFD